MTRVGQVESDGVSRLIQKTISPTNASFEKLSADFQSLHQAA
ncbi:hypothetical protein [Streptococcus thoraltensis]